MSGRALDFQRPLYEPDARSLEQEQHSKAMRSFEQTWTALLLDERASVTHDGGFNNRGVLKERNTTRRNRRRADERIKRGMITSVRIDGLWPPVHGNFYIRERKRSIPMFKIEVTADRPKTEYQPSKSITLALFDVDKKDRTLRIQSSQYDLFGNREGIWRTDAYHKRLLGTEVGDYVFGFPMEITDDTIPPHQTLLSEVFVADAVSRQLQVQREAEMGLNFQNVFEDEIYAILNLVQEFRH